MFISLHSGNQWFILVYSKTLTFSSFINKPSLTVKLLLQECHSPVWGLNNIVSVALIKMCSMSHPERSLEVKPTQTFGMTEAASMSQQRNWSKWFPFPWFSWFPSHVVLTSLKETFLSFAPASFRLDFEEYRFLFCLFVFYTSNSWTFKKLHNMDFFYHRVLLHAVT